MLTAAMTNFDISLSDAEITNLLTAATTDVLWPSESYEPFEVLLWTETPGATLDETTMRQQIGVAAATIVQRQTLDELFEPMLEIQDWFTDEERFQVEQYEQVLFTLQQHLTDLQVYRVGDCEVDIYITGQLPTGDWAVLKTLSVET